MAKMHGSILEYIKKGVVPKTVVFWGVCLYILGKYIFILYTWVLFGIK